MRWRWANGIAHSAAVHSTDIDADGPAVTVGIAVAIGPTVSVGPAFFVGPTVCVGRPQPKRITSTAGLGG